MQGELRGQMREKNNNIYMRNIVGGRKNEQSDFCSAWQYIDIILINIMNQLKCIYSNIISLIYLPKTLIGQNRGIQ